jgi:hypothetical protein
VVFIKVSFSYPHLTVHDGVASVKRLTVYFYYSMRFSSGGASSAGPVRRGQFGGASSAGPVRRGGVRCFLSRGDGGRLIDAPSTHKEKNRKLFVNLLTSYKDLTFLLPHATKQRVTNLKTGSFMKLTITYRLKLCWEIMTARSGHAHTAHEKQLSTFLRGYDAGRTDEKLTRRVLHKGER